MKFDVVEFYPSISQELMKSNQFASKYVVISTSTPSSSYAKLY